MSMYYNESIKNEYLNTIKNEGSRNTIQYIFLASKSAEQNILNKDLYNFDKDQIGEVLKNMSLKSNHTARTSTNFIKGYITWAIKNGFRDNNLNPLSGIGESWYGKFVDRNLKMHYTYDEIISIIEGKNGYFGIANAQDQAMLMLIFEHGLTLEELQLLNYYDINWGTNDIVIKKREQNQIITVSNQLMRYIENAYHEKVYRSFNANTGEYSEKQLIQSDFIFKNAIHRRLPKNNTVSTQTFYSRLIKIKEKEGLEYLTQQSLKQSGMIHMAVELYKEYGKIGTEQIRMIGDRYNYKKMISNGSEYHNASLIGNSVNKQNIKDLYDIDIDI